MIISRTPYRVSFFGGGTDYPVWYEKHGGAVLATSINRYCYLTGRYLPPFFEYKHRVVYSRNEVTHTIDEIQHPSVRECLRFLKIEDGVEIHHDGDLPKQTGLGSSSSFTVGLLHVLHAMKGQMVSPLELAREAIHVERDLCHDNVGSQDQTTAAFGGLNVITFSPGDVISIRPVTLTKERVREFQDHLMFFFTGFSRISSEVAAEQIQNIPKKESELRRMRSMVDEGLGLLSGAGDIREFGKLLDESWRLKRGLSSRVSNDRIDAIYEAGRKAGAIGGKLCGAGGGGFVLFFVEPDRQKDVRAALGDYVCVPIEIEWLGSQIIFYEPHAPKE